MSLDSDVMCGTCHKPVNRCECKSIDEQDAFLFYVFGEELVHPCDLAVPTTGTRPTLTPYNECQK